MHMKTEPEVSLVRTFIFLTEIYKNIKSIKVLLYVSAFTSSPLGMSIFKDVYSVIIHLCQL